MDPYDWEIWITENPQKCILHKTKTHSPFSSDNSFSFLLSSLSHHKPEMGGVSFLSTVPSFTNTTNHQHLTTLSSSSHRSVSFNHCYILYF